MARRVPNPMPGRFNRQLEYEFVIPSIGMDRAFSILQKMKNKNEDFTQKYFEKHEEGLNTLKKHFAEIGIQEKVKSDVNIADLLHHTGKRPLIWADRSDRYLGGESNVVGRILENVRRKSEATLNINRRIDIPDFDDYILNNRELMEWMVKRVNGMLTIIMLATKYIEQNVFHQYKKSLDISSFFVLKSIDKFFGNCSMFNSLIPKFNIPPTPNYIIDILVESKITRFVSIQDDKKKRTMRIQGVENIPYYDRELDRLRRERENAQMLGEVVNEEIATGYVISPRGVDRYIRDINKIVEARDAPIEEDASSSDEEASEEASSPKRLVPQMPDDVYSDNEEEAFSDISSDNQEEGSPVRLSPLERVKPPKKNIMDMTDSEARQYVEEAGLSLDDDGRDNDDLDKPDVSDKSDDEKSDNERETEAKFGIGTPPRIEPYYRPSLKRGEGWKSPPPITESQRRKHELAGEAGRMFRDERQERLDHKDMIEEKLAEYGKKWLKIVEDIIKEENSAEKASRRIRKTYDEHFNDVEGLSKDEMTKKFIYERTALAYALGRPVLSKEEINEQARDWIEKNLKELRSHPVPKAKREQIKRTHPSLRKFLDRIENEDKELLTFNNIRDYLQLQLALLGEKNDIPVVFLRLKKVLEELMKSKLSKEEIDQQVRDWIENNLKELRSHPVPRAKREQLKQTHPSLYKFLNRIKSKNDPQEDRELRELWTFNNIRGYLQLALLGEKKDIPAVFLRLKKLLEELMESKFSKKDGEEIMKAFVFHARAKRGELIDKASVSREDREIYSEYLHTRPKPDLEEKIQREKEFKERVKRLTQAYDIEIGKVKKEAKNEYNRYNKIVEKIADGIWQHTAVLLYIFFDDLIKQKGKNVNPAEFMDRLLQMQYDLGIEKQHCGELIQTRAENGKEIFVKARISCIMLALLTMISKVNEWKALMIEVFRKNKLFAIPNEELGKVDLLFATALLMGKPITSIPEIFLMKNQVEEIVRPASPNVVGEPEAPIRALQYGKDEEVDVEESESSDEEGDVLPPDVEEKEEEREELDETLSDEEKMSDDEGESPSEGASADGDAEFGMGRDDRRRMRENLGKMRGKREYRKKGEKKKVKRSYLELSSDEINNIKEKVSELNIGGKGDLNVLTQYFINCCIYVSMGLTPVASMRVNAFL